MGFDIFSHSVIPVRSPSLSPEIQNPLPPMETGGDIDRAQSLFLALGALVRPGVNS